MIAWQLHLFDIWLESLKNHLHIIFVAFWTYLVIDIEDLLLYEKITDDNFISFVSLRVTYISSNSSISQVFEILQAQRSYSLQDDAPNLISLKIYIAPMYSRYDRFSL